MFDVNYSTPQGLLLCSFAYMQIVPYVLPFSLIASLSTLRDEWQINSV